MAQAYAFSLIIADEGQKRWLRPRRRPKLGAATQPDPDR